MEILPHRYPLLLAGCTGCRACAQICPDFVFQVYKYETPLSIVVPEPSESAETAETILRENAPDAFLRKPFIPPTLLKCVQRVLTTEFKGICHESALL